MFASFDENPAMTLRVIKETKRYGRTHGRTHTRTDNVKTVYPLQTKFAGEYNIWCQKHMIGLGARKPVLGGLRTTQAQTNLCSPISAFVIRFLESIICKLAACEISIF